MKARYAPVALAALLLAPATRVSGQAGGTAAAPAAAPTKIAILNVRQAIISSAEGRQASAELQSQFAPRQNDLENLRKQIQAIEDRIRTGETTLSDDEKARLTRQGEQLGRQYQRKQQEVQEDVNSAQNEVIDRIGRKMIDVLDRYARENGYAVVFDVSAQTTPVVYGAPQIDITQDIIRLYDQAFPVKASAPAPPSQPRSQPGQARPAQQQPPAKPKPPDN